MNKSLTITLTLMAAATSYFGAMECFEMTAPIWIGITWFGGFFTALLLLHAMKAD